MSSKELTMYLEKELEQLKEKGLYNTIDILESENGACIIVDGKNISGMKPDDVRKKVLGTEIQQLPRVCQSQRIEKSMY